MYYASSNDSATKNQLAIMARKLYRFITPLMVIALVCGSWMIVINLESYLQSTWLWFKLVGVFLLIIYHFQCGRYVSAVNRDDDSHTHVFFRFFNEIPVVFLFAIVILAVFKPF